MTVATKDVLGGEGEGRQALARMGNPWRRLWQVPLLLAGLAVFGLGLRALVKTIRPAPFEQQVKGVRGLLEAAQYVKAIEQINMLGNYYKEPMQQAQLQELAGDVHYLAEQEQLADGAVQTRLNYERVEDHYSKAVAWGITPSLAMNERWGEAALGLGDAKTAVEKLEEALADAGEDDHALLKRHGKELIAAYMELGDRAKALEMVERLLAIGSQPPDDMAALEERIWGLCKRIEIALGTAGSAADVDALNRALAEAKTAIAGMKDRDPVGRVLAWIGRAELESGDAAGAQRDLAEARKRFAVHHIDDGRAAVLLAKIAESHGDLDLAGKLFQEVVGGHAGTRLWAAARFGRAEVSMLQGEAATEQVVGDYQYAIDAVKEGTERAVGKAPEMITRGNVLASLINAYQGASDSGRLEDALVYLRLEGELGERETPDRAYRLATTKERRGLELLAESRKLEGAARAEKDAAGRALFASAADDFLRHAKLTTLDDEQSGASLWKAGEMLDRAGDTQRAAALYERLTIQRPRDGRVSEGLLTLGRLYESAGGTEMIEKAVAIYERNLKENAKTPAAYTSTVNLARCYMFLGDQAKAPAEREIEFGAAEKKLLSLVEENTDLQPTAREFRESLLALGELYFRRGDWANAINRLEEAQARYPEDPETVRTLFLLGESYRNSALQIAEAIEKDPGIQGRAALEGARLDRLAKGAARLTRVIALLDAWALGEENKPTARKLSALEESYLRTSYMDRAACYFERGEYDQAIRWYDQAAAHFSEEVTAVEAYVQIVNAYLALKQPEKASAAAERGSWILKRVPDSAFNGTVTGAGREHYEKLLAMRKE